MRFIQFEGVFDERGGAGFAMPLPEYSSDYVLEAFIAVEGEEPIWIHTEDLDE